MRTHRFPSEDTLLVYRLYVSTDRNWWRGVSCEPFSKPRSLLDPAVHSSRCDRNCSVCIFRKLEEISGFAVWLMHAVPQRTIHQVHTTE